MINIDMSTQPTDAKDLYHLGLLYEIGRGVPQDEGLAIKWYTKAAEQGNPTAQFHLGVSYSTGRGVPLDYDQAVKWFRKSADQGDQDAQYCLGIMYENGRNLGESKHAIEFYIESVDQGLI